MLTSIRLLSLVLLAQSPADPPPQPIDPCDSVMIHQVRAAMGDLEDAIQAHDGDDRKAFIAVYEGTHALEAHLMRPGMTWTRPVRLELVANPQIPAMLIRRTINPQSGPQVHTMLIHRGRVAEQPAAGQPFVQLDPAQASAAIADAACWFPSSALLMARQAAPSCRPGPPLGDDAHRLTPISFTDPAGRACTLLLDADHRLSRVERLFSHSRQGDICHWTQFDGWQRHGGLLSPGSVRRFIVADSTTSSYELSLVSAGTEPVDDASFTLPAEHRADIPDWGQSLPSSTGMEFVELGPGVCAIEVAAADQRVIVIERDRDLVLLGAPEGDAISNALLAALEDRYDGKNVAIAAPSHHHPASSGGLRALAAAGATILIPRELESFARNLISRPTSLGPPAVPGPPQPRLELFDHHTTIDCGHTRVELINIAEHSAHAFSYVVFHLPEHELVFEDDLGYFPLSGATKAGPRLLGLVGQLEALGIKPRRLVQGWPVKNVLREVEWSAVTGLVEAERDKQRKP